MHRAPDTQFPEVRGLQGPKGVHARPETGIQGQWQGRGTGRVAEHEGEMGQEVPRGHTELAGQLGEPIELLCIFRTHQKDHIHHQRGGGLSQAGAKGDQDQGRVHQRHGPYEADLSGNYEHQEEVDLAIAELGHDRPTIIY